MRIAILVPTFSKFSGPDRVVEEEAEALSKKNEVVVFAFKGDISPKNYDVVFLGAPRSAFLERLYRLFFFADFFKIRKLTDKLRDFDEIISFMYPMTILACNAKKKFNKRYIYYDMGIAFPELFFKLSERIYLRIFRWLTKQTIKSADKAICISGFLKQELQKEVNLPAEIKYVNIDKKRFNKNISKAKADEIKKKFDIKGKMLLYVGRISPHKGIHLLIKAFKIVNEKFPDAKLVIVGKHTFDDYSKKLKALANENVIFAGFVPDGELPYYYKAADLYTTATLWEGFDIPAVEAQAAGKKVVAFNIGSHPEVIKDGTLVEPGNVEKFADAVLRLLEK